MRSKYGIEIQEGFRPLAGYRTFQLKLNAMNATDWVFVPLRGIGHFSKTVYFFRFR